MAAKKVRIESGQATLLSFYFGAPKRNQEDDFHGYVTIQRKMLCTVNYAVSLDSKIRYLSVLTLLPHINACAAHRVQGP